MSKAIRYVFCGAGIVAASYLALAGFTWIRFGSRRRDLRDSLLDRFMPEYDIIEHHEIPIDAGADAAFAAACGMDLQQSRIVRAIFKSREIFMGAEDSSGRQTTSFLEQTKTIGWGVLAEIPGREIVLGAATKPWTANPVFEPVPPENFLAFNKPDYVKIAWTLRADPEGADHSVFRTQTSAIATDDDARSKFRLYWSLVSPGVNLIRRMSLGLVKSGAEHARESGTQPSRPISEHG
jgi:hypothetical protein